MTDQELFDIEDINVTPIPRKGRNEILLSIKGERALNLMRYYLALRAHVIQLENEIGVMAEQDLEQ